MIHSHVHTDYSNYSMQDSVNRIDNIIARLKELGQTTWAISDHGTCSGISEAYKKSKKAGIKLIPGMEGYLTASLATKQRDLRHITFWAKDNEGLQNLYRLCTESHGDKGLSPDNFHFKGRCDVSLIRKYSKGLMLGSACLGSWLRVPVKDSEGKVVSHRINIELLEQFIDIFGVDDVFLEVHTYQCQEQYDYNVILIELARKYGIKLIAATDAHFTWKEDNDLHAHFKNTSKVQEGDEHLNETLYIQSADEIRGNLSYLPREVVEECIANTQILSEKSNVSIAFGGKNYPSYQCDSPFAEVRQQCVDGWRKLVANTGVDEDDYGARIKYELSVLEAQDYCSYFLITNSYLRWAREQGIPIGRGRGSVVASMVSYLMGMTALDSIKYNLVFERFAHNERLAPPDIDCDVSRRHRGKVIDFIQETYGEVYQVRTFQTIGAKGAIRRAGAALGWSQDDLGDLLKGASKYESDDEDEEQLSSYEQKRWIVEHLRTKDNSVLIDLSLRFVGIISGYGKHASCVLILDKDDDVSKYSSVERQNDSKTNKPYYIVSCAYPLLEDMGLMKADVLGLKTLDVIQDCVDAVKLHGINIDIEKILLDDPATFTMLCEGKTKGCFQIGSRGMTQLVKDIVPSHFNDLIPLVALFRPGCLNATVDDVADKDHQHRIDNYKELQQWIHENSQYNIGTLKQLQQWLCDNPKYQVNGMHKWLEMSNDDLEKPNTMVETYVKVRSGALEPLYLHEKLRPILAPTYSIILYQEQILEIAKSLCGYSLGEADNLRRIIGKKKIDEMAPAIDTMIERGVSNGMPRDVMEKITKQIVEFAAYCFNKAHSAAYGLLAYQTSYLKANFPLEYMCASMNNEDFDQEKILVFIKELKKMEITLLPPDISKGNTDFVIEGDAIRMGLHYIKGIGENLKLDDVSSYEAVKSSNNKGVKVALVKAGALDCFGMSRISMLVDVSQTKQGIAKAELNIAKNSESIIKLTVDNESKKDKTTKVYTENQRKIKKYTEDIPKLQEKLKEAEQAHEALKHYENVIGEIEVLGYSDGIKPNVKLGKLTNVFSKIVSNGSTMGWVTLKSDYGEFRCSAFEDHWNTFKDLISVGSKYLFVCKETNFGFNLVELQINGKVYAAPKKSYGKRG